MRRRLRGTTIMEMICTMFIIAMVVMGSTSLLVSGLQAFSRTSSDSSLTATNAQGLRRVAETLRGAMFVSVDSTGRTITYRLPARSTTADALTGERELRDPLAWDGVTRTFAINATAGTLTDSSTNRVLVRRITSTDPKSGSSQYGQAYAPFTMSTIGSARAVTINLITLERNGTQSRYVRLKTTAMVRNFQ